MRKRRQIELFSVSFLDLLSGALGAVIILYVAMPKQKPVEEAPKNDTINEIMTESLQKTREELEQVKLELAKANEKLAAIPQPSPEPEVRKDLDVGFKFKGKEILFIIDTSYSMTEEDRMGQVKAGLKMLLTSMSGEFKVDVVQFPFGERAPFKVLWGDIKENNRSNQGELFDHLYSLRPRGGTPAREVLTFALDHYDNISDIVFLSDGAPTFHNSNKKDDIFDILRVIREKNFRKIQINTIGVGSGFRDKTSDQYKFMYHLSIENQGFFVGF
jgi:hypothetical protein